METKKGITEVIPFLIMLLFLFSRRRSIIHDFSDGI